MVEWNPEADQFFRGTPVVSGGRLFNVVTWNMQGSKAKTENLWSEDIGRLFSNPFDPVQVACFQESGNPPLSAKASDAPPGWATVLPPGGWRFWESGSKSRETKNYYGLWQEWDTAGHRVNLAICARRAPSSLLYVASPMGGRAALGMRFVIGGVGVDIYSVHCWSGTGNDAGALLAAVQANSAGRRWIAVGDFNQAPDDLVTHANNHHVASQIYAPASYTRPASKNCLDYMAIGGWAGGYPTVITSPLTLVASDHVGVRFRIPFAP